MSSIQVVKAGMRFQSAGERPRCGNCCHHSLDGRAVMRCKEGGFTVSPYAICNRYAEERLPAAAPPSPA